MLYNINKLVNRPFEYKGLKGKYVYMGFGVVGSLIFSTVIIFLIFNVTQVRLVLCGANIVIHVIIISSLRSKSKKYEELNRDRAKRKIPPKIVYSSSRLYMEDQILKK